MRNNKSVAVIIPAFNEEKKITDTVNTVPEWVDQIICVDDNSLDSTRDILFNLQKVNPKIMVISHEANLGVGGAIISGYRYALSKNIEVCAVMDGDGQMDPQELHRLIDPIAQGFTDMSKGNRFFSSDSYVGMPRIRAIGNILLSLLTKVGSGYWNVVDPQNGFVAVRADFLAKLQFNKLSLGYDFQNDFICWMRMLDARILDVNIRARYQDETSTLKIFPTSIRILRTLIKGFWRRMLVKNFFLSFNMIPLFLFTGLFFLIPGIFFGAMTYVENLGPSVAAPGDVALITILITLGIQFVLVSFILDYISEPRPKLD